MDRTSFSSLALAGIMAGGLLITGCEDATSSKTPESTATGIAAAKTLAQFQAECAKSGGTFKAHDCSGMNECKGHSFQEDKAVASHECKGHSACQGGSCLES